MKASAVCSNLGRTPEEPNTGNTNDEPREEKQNNGKTVKNLQFNRVSIFKLVYNITFMVPDQ